jgi:hypothetical protein
LVKLIATIGAGAVLTALAATKFGSKVTKAAASAINGVKKQANKLASRAKTLAEGRIKYVDEILAELALTVDEMKVRFGRKKSETTAPVSPEGTSGKGGGGSSQAPGSTVHPEGSSTVESAPRGAGRQPVVPEGTRPSPGGDAPGAARPEGARGTDSPGAAGPSGGGKPAPEPKGGAPCASVVVARPQGSRGAPAKAKPW